MFIELSDEYHYAKEFLKLLNPVAPHITEELWNTALGNNGSIAYEKWPVYDEALTVEDTIEIAVQVNGKTRALLEINKDMDKDTVLTAAKEALGSKLTGTIVKEIYVPGKIVNIVCK